MINIFIGTYTSKKSKGIYSLDFCENTGAVSNVRLFAQINAPKYLQMHNGLVFSVCEIDKSGGVAAFDKSGKCISKLAFEKTPSCYILKHEHFVFTANYHTGEVSKLQFCDNEFTFIEKIEFGKMAGCHQIIINNNDIIIPCLNLNSVFVLSTDFKIKHKIAFPKGAGPRHAIIDNKRNLLYFVCELSGEIVSVNTITYKIENITPTATNTQNQECAAIRISNDNNTLYISNRSENTISAFEISGKSPKLIQTVNCGGIHPRDFLNISDKFMFVANRDTNEFCVFELKGGKIGNMILKTQVYECVSIISD